MEKRDRIRRNLFLDKLDYLDAQVKALDELNIEDRLCKIERQLLELAPEIRMIRTNQMLRADHRAMASSASSNKRSTKRSKDKTVYLFEHEQVRKKDIVLKCLKRYVAENGISCAAPLIERFPPTLRRTYGVIRPIEKVLEQGWERCFHMDDVLHLADGEYVVCSAWDVSNLSPVIDIFINELHYDIAAFENGRRKDDFSWQNK